MANPLIQTKVQLLESFLDQFIAKHRLPLGTDKQSLCSHQARNHCDITYRSYIGQGFSFWTRLYWVVENSGPVPYIHVELGLARMPEKADPGLLRLLLSTNQQMHDPLKIGLIDSRFLGVFLRGRVDKVAPDYWESLIGDLTDIGAELYSQLSKYSPSRLVPLVEDPGHKHGFGLVKS